MKAAFDLIQRTKNGPCSDCGGSFDPVVMEFDHRPGEVKLFSMSSFRRKTLDEVVAEIAKCDVVCSNCHRLRTKKRGYPGVGRKRAKLDLKDLIDCRRNGESWESISKKAGVTPITIRRFLKRAR